MRLLRAFSRWLTVPLIRSLYRIPQARVASRPPIYSDDAPSRLAQFKALRQQDGRKP
jgi:hypothetical protein